MAGDSAAQVVAQPIGETVSRTTSSLGDLLERVLDRGIVIAGDIQINVLDIELLTVKLRLVVASIDTAREMGIDWWETDPWLHGPAALRAAARGRRLADREERQLTESAAGDDGDDG